MGQANEGERAVEYRGGAFDLWLAMTAGHRVWSEGSFVAGPRERVAAAAAMIGTAGCTIAAVGAVLLRQPANGDRVLFAAAGVVALAAVVLMRDYLAVVAGRSVGGARFWPSVVRRGVLFLVLVGGLASCFHRGHVAAGAVAGLLCGGDLTLTLWALGSDARWLDLWRRFLLSPLHLGTVGAVLAAIVTDTGPPPLVLVGMYAGLWAALGVALATMRLLEALGEHFDSHYEAHRVDVAARERAHRAHWLHDDVLSEVRLASLRIGNGSASAEQVNAELLDLDHRLRLRQLEEMIRDGRPPIYEVLQPHLRRAQNLGVRLVGVPTHEVTGVTIGEDEAHLLNRALSVLMANAINAGATELSVGLELPPDAIDVSVTDDAGGFDLSATPAGRGLHHLATELGPGSVTRTDVPGGSRVTARVPRRGAAVASPAPVGEAERSPG